MIKLNNSLRISVIDDCNFACLYCPRNGSMENYCPNNLRNKKLNTNDFINVIKKLLDNYQFTKIVITGGEPLLCKDLAVILKVMHKYDNEIELDTNGSLFSIEKWNNIKNYIDGVKISLDSLNENTFQLLTTTKNKNYINNIKELIKTAKLDNIKITINCVCTKINAEDIMQLVEFCVSNKINLSLLDLYYTKETENFWKDNYINISVIKKLFSDKYGELKKDDSFGCDFENIYYNDEKNYIRFKSSSDETMRDELCEKCLNYCQEGIFCLRLSRQGWITACQLNDKNGVLASKDFNIDLLIKRLNNAKADKDSFKKMLKRNEVFDDVN